MLKELLCDAYISLYFERSLKTLDKSHLQFLSHLLIQISKKIKKPKAILYFKNLFSEGSDEDFEKWLDILNRLSLINVKDDAIHLTDEGREFLHYVMEREYVYNQQ